MSFDPEKVERFDDADVVRADCGTEGIYVNASDYDALLALYRELLEQLHETQASHLAIRLTT